MRKTSKKIRSLLGDYYSWKKIREHLTSKYDNDGKYVKEYRLFELKALRELAVLKEENPNTFRVACFYDKLTLN